MLAPRVQPWELIDTAPVPGEEGELRLYRRGEDHVIRLGTAELMSSRRHGSEHAVAQLACKRIAGRRRARVLIGGLGMGYTLRAALDELGDDAQVVQAELVPAVVRWNREVVGHYADHPLADPRVVVREADVVELIRAERGGYDAIVLDVDNGPEGMVVASNDRLYDAAGLAAAHRALRPGGVLAVWSATGDRGFTQRLRDTGFAVEEQPVGVRGERRGVRHMVWLATRR